MSYKQERRNGRMVTIDTRTGEEVGAFQGPIGDFFNDIKTMGQITLSDIQNLKNDIGGHLIYSDTAVDKNGRPLTRAQAGEVTGPTREQRLQSILQAAPQTPTVQTTLTQLDPKKQSGGGLDTKDGKVKNTFLTMEKVNEDIMDKFGLERFSSNQLPATSTSNSNDFSSEDAQVMGMSAEDAKIRQSGGSVKTTFKDGVQSDGQIFKDPGSRAFLDYEGDGGSMGAFRAAERARGMVRVGGQNYITHPLAGQDGQPEFQVIKDQERRDINAGRITAQDLSNQYMQRITGADTPMTPAPGEFPETASIFSSNFTPDFNNLGGFATNLVEEGYEIPDFTAKLGFTFGEQPNTGMFAIDPEVHKYVSKDAYNSKIMKD